MTQRIPHLAHFRERFYAYDNRPKPTINDNEVQFPHGPSMVCHTLLYNPDSTEAASVPMVTDTECTQEYHRNIQQRDPQTKITQWTCHRPFIHGISTDSISAANCGPLHPRGDYTDHLSLFGTSLLVIDPSKILRVCIQNTQHSFQLYDQTLDMTVMIDNLRNTDANMFMPISLNVNWHNKMNWVHRKCRFCVISQHTHLSAVSSNIGLDPSYKHSSLVGCVAIATFGSWSSKVCCSSQVYSGLGTYTINTIQGKHNKLISFIAAYISVQRGSNIGTESLYAQQVTLHEKKNKKNGSFLNKSFCPRKDAICHLNTKISELQKAGHAIVLMLDANQSLQDCYSGNSIKPYSIEWLRVQRGLVDPFISLAGSRPSSTTLTPQRDINFILTFGISATSISTVEMSQPPHSDHLGIILDLLSILFFSASHSAIAEPVPRMLSASKKTYVDAYIKYVEDQCTAHKLSEWLDALHPISLHAPHDFSATHIAQLNIINRQMT